jgi:hypothetical protein
LSRHDLTARLRHQGFRNFRDFERIRDGYSVKALAPNGRRVKLFVDGSCGRIRHWRYI